MMKYGDDGRNQLITHLHKRYGPTFLIRTPAASMVLTADPHFANIVMNDREIFRTRGTLGFDTFVPEGLLGLPTGPKWQLHRKLLSKGFSEPAMKNHADTIIHELNGLLEKWHRAVSGDGNVTQTRGVAAMSKRRKPKASGLAAAVVVAKSHRSLEPQEGEVCVHDGLTRMTFDVIGKIALGHDFDTVNDPHSKMFSASEILITESARRSFQTRAEWYFPYSRIRAFNWANHHVRTVSAMTLSVLGLAPDTPRHEMKSKQTQLAEDEVRASLTNQQDIKSAEKSMMMTMIQANASSDSGKMSYEEILQESMTLMGAGHETSSNTASWALLLLAENRGVQTWLLQELLASLQPVSHSPNSANSSSPLLFHPPSFQQWRKMERTLATVLEALRLFPTVPAFPRLAGADTKLGEFDIPKDTLVLISQAGMNRNPELWGDNAEDFFPARFLVPGGPSLSGFLHGIPVPPLPKRAKDDAAGAPQPLDPSAEAKAWGFLPFGAGPRMCLGRRLALMETVMIVAGVVANFEVRMRDGMKIQDIEPKTDITMGPKFGLPLVLVPRTRESLASHPAL
eukprot:TRINITY_DN2610_c0_g1_i1.p1 TRINITY_DN2610_c0_g1~~TRINITY_DN2610_c0_g1_i1.p1  ORF type:complete len:636 (+),score=142.32 TRINITY_DN2610_c0_g1_i1:206-1909(+)